MSCRDKPQWPPGHGGEAGPSQGLQVARQAHYQEWLGTPAYVWHEEMDMVPHVDLYVYPPATELGRDAWTLITSGMSDARMSVPAGQTPDRVELIQYVRDFDSQAMAQQGPWYVSTMLYLAHYPFAHHTWLGAGHTVPNGEPPAPLTWDSLLTTAMFMEPRFEAPGFREGLHWQDERVGLLWLTFITNAELAYKLDKGAAALVALFERQHLPKVLEPLRPPLVLDQQQGPG